MSRSRDINIKNLNFNKEEKGFFFSKSYLIYTWKFKLDNVNRIISLAHSKIKGKRVITLDNKQICLFRKYTYNFSYEFTIDTNKISIKQINEGYVLKIDGMNFQKLVNQEKLQKFSILRNEYIKEHPIVHPRKMEMNQFNYTIQNRENYVDIEKEDEKKEDNESESENKEIKIKEHNYSNEENLNNFENVQKENSKDENIFNNPNINDNNNENNNNENNNDENNINENNINENNNNDNINENYNNKTKDLLKFNNENNSVNIDSKNIDLLNFN